MCDCLSHAPTGGLAHNSGRCPDWECNWRSLQAGSQSPEPHQLGLKVNKFFFKDEWKKALIKWKEIKNEIDFSTQLNDFHGIALVAYAGDIAIVTKL